MGKIIPNYIRQHRSSQVVLKLEEKVFLLLSQYQTLIYAIYRGYPSHPHPIMGNPDTRTSLKHCHLKAFFYLPGKYFTAYKMISKKTKKNIDFFLNPSCFGWPYHTQPLIPSDNTLENASLIPPFIHQLMMW